MKKNLCLDYFLILHFL